MYRSMIELMSQAIFSYHRTDILRLYYVLWRHAFSNSSMTIIEKSFSVTTTQRINIENLVSWLQFCPKAGLPQQTQEPRLRVGAVASRCFPHYRQQGYLKLRLIVIHGQKLWWWLLFQCQPTALLRASGSAQGRQMALGVVYFRITHRLGRPHYVWDEYLYSVLQEVDVRVTMCNCLCRVIVLCGMMMMKGRENVKHGAGSQPALLEKHQGGRQV